MKNTDMSDKERTNLFNSIFAEYHGIIQNYIQQKVGNPELAEELANDVFVKAHKHLDNFDEAKSTMSTWLHVIANNIVIDSYRKYAKERDISCASDLSTDIGDHEFEYQFVSEAEADSVMKSEELNTKIESSFESLKPTFRVYAELFFRQEMTYKEIAYILDVPMGSVKGMISRCRAMLQTTLTPQLAMS